MGSRRPCGRPTRPEVVEARAAEATIEVFHRDTRIASHARSGVKRRHTTIPEHMPSAHR
jgi:transposase